MTGQHIYIYTNIRQFYIYVYIQKSSDKLFQILFRNVWQKNKKQNKKPPPIYYNSGTRKGQILHSRLRLKCSSLSLHLHDKNLNNVPYC